MLPTKPIQDDPLNPISEGTSVHKAAHEVFPSTASKLDILILRQLLLKATPRGNPNDPSGLEYLRRLNRPITAESLLDFLRPNECTDEAPVRIWGCFPRRPFFEHFHPLAPDLAFVIQRLAAAFTPSDRNKHHEITYLCVLNASVEDTPILSPSTLTKLSRLTTLPFVTESAVRGILDDEQFGIRRDHPNFSNIHALKEKQIMDCIFYTKQGGERHKWTNADTLMDVLNNVQTKAVERMRFGSCVSYHQLEARRSVSSLLAYLLMITIVIVAVANIGIWSLYMVGSATSPTFGWSNYCEHGPQSVCYFLSRSFATMTTHEDALRFFRFELVNNLWGSVTSPTQSAANAPNGAAWYLGALLIRVSPALLQNDPPPQVGCDHLNLSLPYTLSVTNQVYSCGAMHYTVVPFSYTQEEALAAVSTFNVDVADQDVSVVATYSVFHPSTGALVMNEAAATLKQAGGVIVRSRHYTASTGLRMAILVSYVCYALFFALENTWMMINELRGFRRTTSITVILMRLFTFSLIATAWTLLSENITVDHLVQADFIPRHLDAVAYRDVLVQYCFGGWLLLVIAAACTYLQHIQVVRLVVQLVNLAAAPLVATTLVMLCWFVGFVTLAMFIFGQLQVEFASFVYAFRVMFPFLFGAGDSSVFTEEYTVLGTIFFAIFAIATNFVALNIFNGVMMGPLGDLMSSNGVLMNQLQHSMKQRAKRERYTWWAKQRMTMRMALLPWVNFLFDALPIPDFNWSVVHRFLEPKTSYHYLVNAAKQLYDMQDAINKMHADTVAKTRIELRATVKDWRHSSLLCRTLKRDHQYFGITDTSMTLILLVTMYENKWSLFRDARLAKVIGLWEEEQANLAKEFAPMDEWDFGKGPEGNEEADGEGGSEDVAKPASRESGGSVEKTKKEDEEEQTVPPVTPSVVNAVFKPGFISLDLRPDSDDETEASNPQTPASSAPQELGSLTSFTMLAKKQTDEAEHLQFVFVDYLKNRLLGAYAISPIMTLLLQIVHLGVVLSGYLFLIIVCVGWSESTAYFNADLHAGLRDGLYQESCQDANCTSATTKPMSFSQGGSYSDLQNFISLVVDPQIFSYRSKVNGSSTTYFENESLPITGLATTPVRWSSAVRFQKLTIRQLRGAPVACQMPSSFPPKDMNPSEAARANMFASLSCYSSTTFQTGIMPQPKHSPLPASAYVYQETCPDAWKHSNAGYQYSYPCAGYATEITNSKQLEYASTNWLNDESVRLVVLSFEFYHNQSRISDRPLHTTYDMYVELGVGLAQGEFWVSATQDTATTSLIATQLISLMLTHLWVVLLAFLWWLWVSGDLADAYAHTDGHMIIFTTFVTTVSLIVYYTNLPTATWASVTTCCLATILFTVKFIDAVLIPVTGLISRRATTFPRMSAYIRGRLPIVIPFFVIFWVAFTLSGYVMWGTNLQEYATISQAFKTVSQGFFGGWDFASINVVFPGLAIAVTSVFFVAVTVVLLPTLLSLIVQSAEDANDELSATNEVVALAEKMESKVFFGPIARFALAMWVMGHEMAADSNDVSLRYGRISVFENIAGRIQRLWLRVVTKVLGTTMSRPSAPKPPCPFADEEESKSLYAPLDDTLDDAVQMLEGHQRLRLYEAWRLPLPVECLQPFLGAPRTAQLLRFMHFYRMRPAMQYTAVAFIISELAYFRRKEQIQYDEDAQREMAVMKADAAAMLVALKNLR